MDYELDCEDFLEIVYGDRKGWVDLPTKVARHWVPFYVEWPNDARVTRRIDSSLRDREDLYYSVAMFRARGRNIEDVLPTSWLWADLDEVHPTAGAALGFLPTVAVESSPGRYQALWQLSRPLKPKVLERLNRGLSYALDADKGGWDLTQVLRIPGTRNHKYPDAPWVKLLWLNEETYDPKEIWAAVKGLVPQDELRGVVSVKLPRRPIPTRAKLLLRTPVEQVVEGERSARLWELECLLAESGLSEEEIFELIVGSAWNKWRGVASGRVRLMRDIRKAMRHVARKQVEKSSAEGVQHRDADVGAADETGDAGGAEGDRADGDDRGGRLPFIGYSSFMAMVMEEPRWLIQDIWTAGSHGLIAGEPKTNKTTLALALALSVASGAPFLGQYGVGVQGPVLFVQEENAPWMMQDRLRKLAWLYGLLGKENVHETRAGAGALGRSSVQVDFPRDLPLKFLNNYGFDLGLEEHRDMLEAEVEEMRPVFVVLDPLYLILGGADENSSAQLRPFLKWLLQLRYKYNCAIAVIHHFKKQQVNAGVVRAGQRIMGSGTLHGWVDSALYLDSRAEAEAREGWVRVGIEKEFRSMAPQKSMELSIAMSAPGGLTMEVELSSWSIETVIRDMVRSEPGVTVNTIAEALKMDKRTVLARIRGGALGLRLEEGKAGRGKSHKVFEMNGNA
jgi:hypothetical protein